MRASIAALFSLLLIGSLCGAAGQQQAEKIEPKAPVFRTETNLVSLDVTVTGKRGETIKGLQKSDFAVYENGTKQDVVFFTDENRPVSWGLVVDRSGSMLGMMEEVYNAVLHSVRAGTREDDFFVMKFNHDVEIIQEFTSDRDQLLAASKKLWAMGSTALYDAVALAVDHVKEGQHQKKVLVIVTDGEDNASHIPFEKLLAMVKRSEALIYTVGFFESDLAILKLMERESRKELQLLAEQTGGMAYFPKNMEECDQVCRDIAARVSQQYSLGYYPKNTTWDGEWREIKVELSRADKSVVRARKGYLAVRPGEPRDSASVRLTGSAAPRR
jgi:Ca-activated chloride channel family protein